MTAQQKIQQAKTKLMLEHPYFGSLASALEIEQSDDIEAFVSNGESLQYNDEYFESVEVSDVEFALANGAMHSVLGHQSRAGERYEWLWQLATDYTINNMLVNNGLTLPQKANFQERFDKMYAEEVYELLRDEIPQEELMEKIQEKKKEEQEQKEEQKETQNQEEFAEQIFQKMNRQGTLPQDLQYTLPQYFSHQIDWREALYGYIASHSKSSFSFMPPNMKYLYRGIYLPSLSSDLLRIVIAIDSSGSVDDALVRVFLGEVESIMGQYPNFEIDVIIADSKIQSHQVFLAGEPLSYEIQGRGGTDFAVVFEYIDANIDYPTALLYFTDGYGTFPEAQPSYDTLWIMPDAVEVPFGEVLCIETTL